MAFAIRTEKTTTRMRCQILKVGFLRCEKALLNVRKEIISVTDVPDLHVHFVQPPYCELIPGKKLECNNFFIENNTILVT